MYNTTPLKDRQLAMMNDSSQWPGWPLLALARKSNNDPLGEPGFLIDSSRYKFAVFKANIFMTKINSETLPTIPKEIYHSFEEVLDAGWRVD